LITIIAVNSKTREILANSILREYSVPSRNHVLYYDLLSLSRNLI